MNCKNCSIKFTPPRNRKTTKYCSLKCSAVDRGINNRGENHWNWKGGRDARWLKKIVGPRPSLCDICKEPGKKRNGITLDHNHKTGKFRGWLCSNCNTTLGLVHENIEKLEAIKQYLINNENSL